MAEAGKGAAKAAPTLIERVLKVAGEVGYLKKEEYNPHSRYRYVSIDQYYEAVRESCIKNGLWWSIKEHNPAEFHTINERPVAVFMYTFDLRSVNETLENFDHITVPHPWQGAQTSGSARSYAEKCFLRSLLKMVTGEEDADATSDEPVVDVEPIVEVPDLEPSFTSEDVEALKVGELPVSEPIMEPSSDDEDDGLEEVSEAESNDPVDQILAQAMRQRDQKQLAEEDVGEVMIGRDADGGMPIFHDADELETKSERAVHTVTEVFVQFVSMCDDLNHLKSFWTNNTSAIDFVKSRDTEEFSRIKQAFADRNAKLKG